MKGQKNCFTEILNVRPDLVKVRHGRKGKAQEYVEYSPNCNKILYVAQRAGDLFITATVFPGKNGAWIVGQSFLNANAAAHQAHDMAYNDATKAEANYD